MAYMFQYTLLATKLLKCGWRIGKEGDM